jgi:selenocysteine lyase/cysteine desulfurase
LFCNEFLDKEDKIAVTAEAYKKMLKKALGEDRIITLPELGDFSSCEAYERFVEKVLSDENVKCMLIESLSRRGTLFPLDHFHKISRKCGVELAIDACQSFGRIPHDIPADVIIGSTHKGSELAGSVGFLLLADDFIRRHGIEKVSNLASLDNGGKFDPIVLTRAIYAANSAELGTLGEEGASVDAIGPHKREKITKDLAYKFAQLTQAINRKHGNRIEFFNDHLIYSGEEINKDQLSPIFECRIKGVIFEQVQIIAQRYGVVINEYSEEWDKGNSFRICFHPFMGNDSVKILGRVLEECCGL